MTEQNFESTTMAAATPRRPRSVEDEEDDEVGPTADVHDVGAKIQRADEVYKEYGGYQDRPSKGEVAGWCLYELCSYFTHTVLLTIVFPLIISHAFKNDLPEPAHGWYKNGKGFKCTRKEMNLFEGLTYSRVKVGSMKFSPLECTSISWFSGLILAAPLLATVSIHLDYRQNPQLIAGAATAIGAFFCLPAGALQYVWIMPPYVAAIVAANTVGSAFHNRQLGLMVRGFVGSTIRKPQFRDRQAVASWLSLYATAGGCLGSAAFASFAYYMLRNKEDFTSLWVVSIFSGLLWFLGIAYIFTSTRSNGIASSDENNTRIPRNHLVSIFKYPHAAGSLVGVFLSSFATMSIFTGGLLHIIGQFCTPPKDLIFLWLTYFIFPLLTLPLLQPIQQLIRANAVKMQLFGFFLTTFTSGLGFYYRNDRWHNSHMLFLAAAQGIAAGVCHAFSRILLMDCAPSGKEGAFAVWFSWVRMLGAFTGFAVASSGVGKINKSFGVAFVAAVVGIIALIFSNVSDYGGAVAAGHVREHSEKPSPVHGLDDGMVNVKGKGDSEEARDISLEV